MFVCYEPRRLGQGALGEFDQIPAPDKRRDPYDTVEAAIAAYRLMHTLTRLDVIGIKDLAGNVLHTRLEIEAQIA